ncbi:YkgJ family cysteine cluster protein [Heliorestis acidaminivorans]|uniref:YkgJ family cysteine cluster protein n=1 Tax=Heliorestis acidaminivorans TaxID=553427 RepID=A0A6I0F267_9FIRM|nr:YkgJ family cysteine cluster protein [Heliorestis acidaminivorans]KAB2952563.1 YkgJ family cysteine cluster protein [Heliorestis acidaminivorans]
MEKAVSILSKKFPQGIGYDLVAFHASATVADYVEAVEDFFTANRWSALRHEQKEQEGWGHCLGCPHCCSERIPLTIGDVITLTSLLPDGIERPREGPVHSQDIALALDKFAHIDVVNGMVDITLKRNEQGQCYLFDEEGKRCSYHAWRPLVCRTFFCSYLSHRADKFRQRLINDGEDELVRFLLTFNLLPELWQGKVSIEDYPETAWGKAYDQSNNVLPQNIEKIVLLESFTASLGLVRINR